MKSKIPLSKIDFRSLHLEYQYYQSISYHFDLILRHKRWLLKIIIHLGLKVVFKDIKSNYLMVEYFLI